MVSLSANYSNYSYIFDVTHFETIIEINIYYFPDEFNFPEDPCSPNPCQNEGACQKISTGGFVCNCSEFCSGSQCEICEPCTET